jgi:HNH endonuclease
MKTTQVTPEEVRRLFDYREDGQLVRKVSTSSNARAGDVAGYINSEGYREIRINGQRHYAHRLIFLYHHGRWPEGEIDHASGVKSDNRIENLREATNSQNQANKSKLCTNTSGYRGVSFHKASGKWRTQIKSGGKIRHESYWDNKKQAHIAYLRGASKLFGDFAAHKAKHLAEQAKRERMIAACGVGCMPPPFLTPEAIKWEAAYQARRAARLTAQNAPTVTAGAE